MAKKEESDEGKDDERPSVEIRYSRRLENRAKRKLRTPSRDKVLETLVPKGTPMRYHNLLSPRKLNNYVKVHHRYYHDHNSIYNSDYESSDFVQYSSDESETESSDTSTESDSSEITESEDEDRRNSFKRQRFESGSSDDGKCRNGLRAKKLRKGECDTGPQTKLTHSSDQKTIDVEGRSKGCVRNDESYQLSTDESDNSTTSHSRLTTDEEEKCVATRRKSARLKHKERSAWQEKLSKYELKRLQAIKSKTKKGKNSVESSGETSTSGGDEDDEDWEEEEEEDETSKRRSRKYKSSDDSEYVNDSESSTSDSTLSSCFASSGDDDYEDEGTGDGGRKFFKTRKQRDKLDAYEMARLRRLSSS